MFCPRWGSTQSDEVKFCKACGANLQAVRQVVDTKDVEKKFDWSNTWDAEMFMSGEGAVRGQMDVESTALCVWLRNSLLTQQVTKPPKCKWWLYLDPIE